MEVFHKNTGCQRLVKIVGPQGIDGNAEPLFQICEIKTREKKTVVADDLRRGISDDLVIDLPVAFRFGHIELAGRDVRNGDPAFALDIEDAENKVVPALLDGIHIEIGAGSNYSYDLPFHHALRGPGIFDLLTDGGLVALFHEPCQIAVDRMKRNAAHRCSFGEATAFSCECQFEFPRSDLGVLEEHLVKVAEPVKQDTSRIFFFCLQIVLHHGT